MPKLSSAHENSGLHAFLNRADVRDAGLTVAYLDGFITAAAAGPSWDSFSEFMSIAFGKEPPAFKDEKEAEAVISALLRRHNELTLVFDEAPTTFQPDIRMVEAEVDAWCTGFARAMTLAREEWEAAIKDREKAVLVKPVLCFARASPNEQRAIDRQEGMTADEKVRLIGQIPQCVALLGEHFHDMRATGAVKNVSTAAQPSPANTNEPPRHRKVGRNEPCPCGSGKKRKNCCGAY